MFLLRPKVISLGLSDLAVSLVCRRRPPLLVSKLIDGVNGLSLQRASVLADTLTALLADNLMASGRARAVVTVSDAVARYWITPPIRGARSMRDLEGAARVHGTAVLGIGAEWTIAGDWKVGEPFLCAAIPNWVIEGVRRVFGQSATITTSLSQLLRWCGTAVAQQGWTCVTTPSRTILLYSERGKILVVRSFFECGDRLINIRLSNAARELVREGIRSSMDVGHSIGWLPVYPGVACRYFPESLDYQQLSFVPYMRFWKTPDRASPNMSVAESEAAANLAIGYV